MTIAVLLVHSALQGNSPTTPTTSTQSFVHTVTLHKRKHEPSHKAFYTVQSGDTFGSIALKERITIGQLQALNPGVSTTALQVGQKLRVK